jgi:hypothetical protein
MQIASDSSYDTFLLKVVATKACALRFCVARSRPLMPSVDFQLCE